MDIDEIIVVDDSDVEFGDGGDESDEQEQLLIVQPMTNNSCNNVNNQNSRNSNLQILDEKRMAEDRKNEGNAYFKLHNYKMALQCYTHAINLLPDNASYYGNRSACYIMMLEFERGLDDAKISIQLDETYVKGYVRIVKCYLNMGDLSSAEQVIKKYLELFPENCNLLTTELENVKQLRGLEEKADLHSAKMDYRTCLYHIDAALKIAPVSIRYKLMRAECLAYLGRLSEASNIAITIMQCDTKNVDAIYVRGLTLYFEDNIDKSILHFERTLTLDPDHKRAKKLRQQAKTLKQKKETGNELFKKFKYRDALDMYNEALQVDLTNKNSNSKLYYNRALVNSKLGKLKEAICDCNEALKINQTYLKALLKRAKCYYDLEKFDECIKDYEAAFKLEKSIDTKNLLRDAKFQLKKSKRKDYYKILGIGRNASTDEIKKAYKKRALVHHPDRHSNATEDEQKEQEIKFKEVGEAYAVLSDSNKKMRYDSGQDMEGNSGAFDPSDIYRQFFFTGQPNFPNNNNHYYSGSNFNFNF